MKKIIISIITLLIFFGCAVQKRKYQKGYYVSWKNAPAVQKEKKEGAALCKQDKSGSSLIKQIETTPQRDVFRYLAITPNRLLVLEKAQEKAFIQKDEPCDDLIFKDGTEIKGKVTEVTATEIKYKKCGMLDGPTYVTKKSDIFMIKYANGTRDVFKDEAKPTTPQRNAGNTLPKKTHPLAVASLVLGILAFIPYISIIGAILAIVFGNMAMARIKAQPDVYDGHGMAKAGKILGIIYLALLAVVLAIFILLFILLI